MSGEVPSSDAPLAPAPRVAAIGARAAALWILGAGALAVVVAGAAIFVEDYDAETRDLVSSLERHRALHETMAALLDDEGAEASFLANGEVAAWSHVAEEHDHAHELLARSYADAGTSDAIAALDAAVDARRTWAREVVDVAERGDVDAARARVATGAGDALLGTIRGELDRLERAEETRVEGLLTSVEVRRARVGGALALGALVALALVLGGLFTAWRDNHRAAARARAAEERERRLRQLADSAADLVRIQERGGATTYVSPSAERLLGRSPAEVARLGDELLSKADLSSLRQAIAALERGEVPTPIVHQLQHADGTRRWFETLLLPIHDDDGTLGAWQASSRDVHARTLAENAREVRHSMLVIEAADLRDQARTDPLTGLLNRRGLFEQATPFLAAERAAGRSTAVLFADLDDLKHVNDREGHEMGDRMIRAAADVLRAVAREGDLCARVGGDEMVVVAGSCDDEGITSLSKRLADALARRAKDEPFALSMSVGHALASATSSEPIEELVASADARMYEAKRARKRSAGTVARAR